MSAGQSRFCSRCGTELPGSVAESGLCPACLLKLGLGETAAEGLGRAVSIDRPSAGPNPETRLDSEARLAAGAQLGHYVIERLLGAGGMGAVYAARDTKLHREVALKVIAESITEDPAALARFQREARTLAALRHPSVVTVYSV